MNSKPQAHAVGPRDALCGRNARRPTLNAQRLTLLPSSFSLQPSAFGVRLLSALVLLFAALPAAAAGRDPFWPIGYAPPKPEAKREKVSAPVAKPPEAPPQPTVKPVTEADWSQARKMLVVNGYAQSTRPDTGETRTQVMINRRTFSAGDALSITNLDIHFTWRIESLADRDLKLKQVEARRLKTGTASDLKK